MTGLQKTIIEWLLEGGTIYGNQKYGYRLKDKSGNPLAKFNYRTFYSLKEHLRFVNGYYILNRKYIRGLSKRYWIKKIYIKHLENKKLIQEGKRP